MFLIILKNSRVYWRLVCAKKKIENEIKFRPRKRNDPDDRQRRRYCDTWNFYCWPRSKFSSNRNLLICFWCWIAFSVGNDRVTACEFCWAQHIRTTHYRWTVLLTKPNTHKMWWMSFNQLEQIVHFLFHNLIYIYIARIQLPSRYHITCSDKATRAMSARVRLPSLSLSLTPLRFTSKAHQFLFPISLSVHCLLFLLRNK